MTSTQSIDGQCTCGDLRYRLTERPLIVHGCHCRHCQRQTGAAYAINALIEEGHVELLAGSVRDLLVETPSGRGQTISRCSSCQVAVWSKYHALPHIGDHVLFIRVGTLDQPDAFPPDVHIFTATQQRHVELPPQARTFAGFYPVRDVWRPESLRRSMQLAASAASVQSSPQSRI